MTLSRRRRVAATWALGLGVLLGAAPAAFAHAILLGAVPAAGSTVAGPDVAVQLRFNSRIDGERSRLVLVQPDKQERPLTLERQPEPAVLTGRASGLAPGAYVLRWQVLAADGHITRGEVPFKVR